MRWAEPLVIIKQRATLKRWREVNIRTYNIYFKIQRTGSLLFVFYYLLFGCKGITEVDASKSSRAPSSSFTGNNSALIYPDNPVFLTGKNVTTANFEGLLVEDFITENTFLETNCDFTQYIPDALVPETIIPFKDTTNNNCLIALNDQGTDTQVLQSNNLSWLQPTDSDEFYQVNTFYHVKKMIDRYLKSLSFAHKYVHLEGSMSIPPSTKYNFIDTQSYLPHRDGAISTLQAFSKCIIENNAFFDPAQNTLCFGYDDKSNFRMVQDPSVIYHEVGHVLIKAMMNQRNITSGQDPNTGDLVFNSHPYQSDLGEIFYDEAGAINEGIADYFSFYMNQRTKVAEFAFNKIQGTYRPLEEDEPAHSADVSTSLGERLSYPEFVHYDPANSEVNTEDVHFSSATISHYLVALTKNFKTSCTFSSTSNDTIHEEATNYVLLLLNETLAEIGDLTGKASDIFSHFATLDPNQEKLYFTNLNEEESFLWTQVVNPPNFRRFSRILGKNIFHHISSGLCPGFGLDESEQLLDEYGLLLFKSYEDRGNGLNTNTLTSQSYALYTGKSVFTNRGLIPFSFNTQVTEANRRKSILISKDFIKLDSESTAFIIDSQSDIKNILANLTFEGANVNITQGIAGPEYNHQNTKIGPGEVVALSLNLFNNSNSTMGGVQFLANDWDHMKLNDSTKNYTHTTSNQNGINSGDITGGTATHSPCIFDNFPLGSEGGVTDSDTTNPGNCSFISKTNASLDLSEVVNSIIYPKYDLDAPQPICMVEYNDTNETKWVSQDFYRTYELGLEESDCLNNPSMSGSFFTPNECLIRFLPGASQGVFGKIDAGKTWVETIKTPEQETFTFDAGHLVLLEVNKWVAPGTKFNCRFRVRFTNCSDCYDNFKFGDPASGLTDYADFEYAGNIPYKIINFQLTVEN